MSSDNRTVVSICNNGTVSFWDVRSRKVALVNKLIDVNVKDWLSSYVSVSFQQNYLVCFNVKTIYIYSLNQANTAAQPFIRFNLRGVTGASIADHFTIALSVPTVRKIFVWNVMPSIGSSTATPFMLKYNKIGVG